jgi:GNAT superfamily N-acetyltransferase
MDPSNAPPTEPSAVSDIWVLSKQIDELGGEWTFPVFSRRAINFNIGSQMPIFYEPTSGFDRLWLDSLLQGKAIAYCPPRVQGDVGVSIKVYPSIFDSEDGVIPIPSEGEPSIGEHYLAVLGVKDSETLIIRNSWSGWQHKAGGIGYLTRQYFEEYGTEGIVTRIWNYGPDADTADALLRCNDQKEFNRMWRRRQRYGTQDSVPGGASISLNWYGCWSLDLEGPAEVLMVKLDRHIPVAIAILIHRIESSVSDISDLFVWPSYRRMGFGLLLESYAAERAREFGVSDLGIYLWNSDAIKGKDRAFSFMHAANYTDIEETVGSQFVAYSRRQII